MTKFKNLYLEPARRNKYGKVLTYRGFHKKGFKFEIELYRAVWEPHFEVYSMLEKERLILKEKTTSTSFKKALNDINSFFNNRTIKWKKL